MLYIWLDCEGPWKQRGVVLPFRAVEFRFRAALLDPGTHLNVKLRVVSQTEMSTAADTWAIDGDGRVVMETLSWEGRTFDLGPALHGVFHVPTRHTLSQAVEDANLPEGGLVGAVIDSLTLDFLQSSHGVWETTIAYSIFDREHRVAWEGIPGTPEEKLQWLLQQAAAKDTVRNYLADRHGLTVASPDIQLEPGNGCVVPVGAWQSNDIPALEVVTAVCDHVAVAVLARQATSALGAAVVRIGSPDLDTVRDQAVQLAARNAGIEDPHLPTSAKSWQQEDFLLAVVVQAPA
jgi:hypothetical protein